MKTSTKLIVAAASVVAIITLFFLVFLRPRSLEYIIPDINDTTYAVHIENNAEERLKYENFEKLLSAYRSYKYIPYYGAINVENSPRYIMKLYDSNSRYIGEITDLGYNNLIRITIDDNTRYYTAT